MAVKKEWGGGGLVSNWILTSGQPHKVILGRGWGNGVGVGVGVGLTFS